MTKPEWKLLDHRWNNFKRWFEAMEEKKDKPYVTIESMRQMIDFCDTIDDKIFNIDSILKDSEVKSALDKKSQQRRSHERN